MDSFTSSKDVDIHGYSFEELRELAQKNPEKLETLRQEWVEELISQSSSAETQRRLRGLEFKLNLERQRKSSSDMGRCVRFSQMMHDSFSELWGSMQSLLGKAQELNELSQENHLKQQEEALGKNVVLLKRKREKL